MLLRLARKSRKQTPKAVSILLALTAKVAAWTTRMLFTSPIWPSPWPPEGSITTWPCMEGAAPPDCAWQPPTVPSVYVEYHRPSDAHQGYHVSDLSGSAPGERATVVDNLEGLIKSKEGEGESE